MSSLPKPPATSESQVVEFFDKFLVKQLEFPSNDVDAVVGFFTKRGFDKTSAVSTATTLLNQAKLDNVKIFKLIDTLKGLTDVQLSALVAQILNVDRGKTSKLGYKAETPTERQEARNIVV